MKNNRGFKRVLKRIKEELKATIEISRILTIKKALITLRAKFDIQIMVHNGRKEYDWIKRHLLKKHEVMNLFFDKIFDGFIPKIEENNSEDKCENIWICWWQGRNNMPEIVKACLKSIEAFSGNHKVIVLTEENYKQYVEFPDWIQAKYKRGIISKTHLSDLLRFELLSKYGGIWLDSTFYCVGSLEKYFQKRIWTIKRPDYRHTSVGCGQFATYSLGCDFENRYIFSYIKQYIYEYWKKYDYMIDYLFLDYLIVHAINNNDNVKKKFAEIEPNNFMCDELLKRLGKAYNHEEWELLKDKTDLFKLSWKSIPQKEINDKKTFYGMLVNDNLK